jgi:TM2 domain-containing membrane protein YozV
MRSFDMTYDIEEELTPRPSQRAPSPGISAVLSVVVPGLGQVYAGRLLAGALWFLGTAAAYAAVVIPGFLVHAFCIWSAYKSAVDWTRYS